MGNKRFHKEDTKFTKATLLVTGHLKLDRLERIFNCVTRRRSCRWFKLPRPKFYTMCQVNNRDPSPFFLLWVPVFLMYTHLHAL